MDEQQAIQALKHGKIDGLAFLVSTYQLKAIRVAYLVTHDPQLAQDVVQDAFLQVHRSAGSFDARRPFEPWFMRSVVRAAVKAAHKADRQLPLSSLQSQAPGADDDQAERWLVAQGSVEAQVESAEEEQRIWQALRQLSPRQRAVIVQRYFLEMNEKEMALELQAAPGTVKWLLNAARRRLRSLLGSERSAR